MEALGVIFSTPWYWLIGGLALMVIELFMPGFYLLWLGLGALEVGLFVAIWPQAPAALQLLMLALCMMVTVAIGARVMRRRRGGDAASGLNAGLAEHVGQEAVAVSDFGDGVGRIRLADTFYQVALEQAGPGTVKAGDRVRVLAVRNGVLVVTPV